MTGQFHDTYSNAKPPLGGERNEEGVNMELNRRDFLKGTIAIGSVAALGGAMAAFSAWASTMPSPVEPGAQLKENSPYSG